jgi:hypothetical protein
MVHYPYALPAFGRSEERRPRMLLEQIDLADIAAQRVERAMAADLGHLEHRRPALRRAGQEALRRLWPL